MNTHDTIWIDGTLIKPPHLFQPEDQATPIVYLTIAVPIDKHTTQYVNVRCKNTTALWALNQNLTPGSDIILKGYVYAPATTSINGHEINMKITATTIATHTSRTHHNHDQPHA